MNKVIKFTFVSACRKCVFNLLTMNISNVMVKHASIGQEIQCKVYNLRNLLTDRRLVRVV